MKVESRLGSKHSGHTEGEEHTCQRSSMSVLVFREDAASHLQVLPGQLHFIGHRTLITLFLLFFLINRLLLIFLCAILCWLSCTCTFRLMTAACSGNSLIPVCQVALLRASQHIRLACAYFKVSAGILTQAFFSSRMKTKDLAV